MVKNVHYRDIKTDLPTAGALIDSLASENDRLWPHERWPAMVLDMPLAVGARGGHSVILYEVEKYLPGRTVIFRFSSPAGLLGTHTFDVEEIKPGQIRLRHTINARLKGAERLGWPLAIRWLHDALLEDALDKAEADIYAQAWRQRPLSPWVKFLIKRKQKAAAAK